MSCDILNNENKDENIIRDVRLIERSHPNLQDEIVLFNNSQILNVDTDKKYIRISPAPNSNIKLSFVMFDTGEDTMGYFTLYDKINDRSFYFFLNGKIMLSECSNTLFVPKIDKNDNNVVYFEYSEYMVLMYDPHYNTLYVDEETELNKEFRVTSRIQS